MNFAELLSPVLPKGRARVITFDDDKHRKDRRRKQIAAAHRIWYLRNAEREKAKRRARYLANRERDKALNRAWRARNREKSRILNRLWARKKRARFIAMGLTAGGTPRKEVNPSHFKKGRRNAARP